MKILSFCSENMVVNVDITYMINVISEISIKNTYLLIICCFQHKRITLNNSRVCFDMYFLNSLKFESFQLSRF